MYNAAIYFLITFENQNRFYMFTT